MILLVSEVVPIAPDGMAETASVAVLHRMVELAAEVAQEYRGAVRRAPEAINAEFGDPTIAVRAAIDMQRRVLLLHKAQPECRGCGLRVGVGPPTVAGPAARWAAASQIVIARAVREGVALDASVRCAWTGTIELPGQGAREDLFEVLWNASAPVAGGRAAPSAVPETGTIEAAAAGPPPAAPTPAVAQASATPVTTTPVAAAPLNSRYEVLGQLGSGGMGVVYKARDRETGEILALKSLRPDVAADAETMERFKNELRLARKITHKNVCRIHDFVRSEGTAYISMEFVEGETLRGVLSRFGSMSVRKGVQIARQVCSGLAEAHAQGVVHRDLKPENVMIDRRGNVKLMDFGIARSLSSGGTTGEGMAIGTPAYMSPEQAEGRSADGRSDIYSLGLILYEMFTGVAAFRADTPVALALKQIRERPPAPREQDAAIPEYLEQTILRCIEKSPSSRFQTIAELDDALSRQTLSPGSTPGVEVDGAAPIGAWFGRREQVLLALGVLGLILLSFDVTDMYPSTRLRPQIGFDEAWSRSRRLVRDLVAVPSATIGLSRKARVWIDGRTQDESQPSDPSGGSHDFTWEFRWQAETPAEANPSEGSIQVDHEGRLRSFHRQTGVESDAASRRAPDVEKLRSRAADLVRSGLGFDASRARLKSDTRYDTNGVPYAHFDWVADQPDERGYRTATVDLSSAGVRTLESSYAHYFALPLPVHYWTDHLGALVFALLLLAVFLTRTVNVGAGRLRRPLLACAAFGAFQGVTAERLFPGLPGGDWTADVLLGLAYFAIVFVVWAAGEDTLLSLWPQKVATWIRPLDGRRLTPRAAVTVLRGTLWGLAALAFFVPLTSFSPDGWIRLRTYVLEWPYVTSGSPALKSLIVQIAVSIVLATGPIALWMSLLRRRLRSVTALVVASGFGTAAVYHPDLVNVVGFGAHVFLVFLTCAWFAWCFFETDLLGTIAALVLFDGVIELGALTSMGADVSLVGPVVVLLLLMALPASAVVSLARASRPADPAGSRATAV